MQQTLPYVCFVGLQTLPVLAREFGQRAAGGAELQQTLLARALVRRGFKVSMVVGDYGQADGAEWEGVTTYKAYRHGAGLPLIRFLHPRWTRVWAALKRADADIYYVSCADMLVAEVALFARAHGRKVIFRVASDSDCDPEKVRIRYWRDRQLYSQGLRMADTVLAQTEAQKTALQRNYGRSSIIARPLAAPGIAARDFSSRDIGILWVGNIRQIKRPELLLELARRMPDLQFTLIGGPVDGHERLYQEVASESAKLANVRFHGRVTHHDMDDFYARARVLANTSDVEGFPNSYLQAWAHGTPVVTFVDPNGVIAAGRLGAVAADIDDLQAHARSLATDEAFWCAASARCRDFLERQFGEHEILPAYLSAITALSRA